MQTGNDSRKTLDPAVLFGGNRLTIDQPEETIIPVEAEGTALFTPHQLTLYEAEPKELKTRATPQ